MKFIPRAAAHEVTLVELGVERLRSLCRALALGEEAPSAMFRRLVTPWGNQSQSVPPSWPSDVGDDHTPFEFSVALGESPELRVMVEPLGAAPSLKSNAEAGLVLLDGLSADCGIDLGRLNLVRDLFLPAQPRGSFALWVAAEFARSGAPHFKVYLNPFAQGADSAPALVEETMMRLGFGGTWPFIARVLTRRGHDLDELMYLSLDLQKSRESRVKVYARHRRCTVADLEAAASGSAAHREGDVTRFLRAVTPGRELFDGRAPFTCYAFVQDAGDLPAAVTTHLPINGYAENDAVIRDRVLEYLGDVGLPKETYRAALTAFANRPLEAGIGLQSYVSIRRHHEKPRLTVYLPAEIYRPGTVAKPPQTMPPSGVREAAGRFERTTIDHDPFVRRLRREPVSLIHLRTLIANHEVVYEGFARRVAVLAGRVSNDEARDLLRERSQREAALQADEPMRQAELAGLLQVGPEAWARSPGGQDESLLVPARRFEAQVERLARSADPWEAVGALAASELFDQQLVSLLEEQLRRVDARATPTVQAMSLRGRLASARGQDSVELARRVPDDALDPVWRGARLFWRAARAFLADVYAHCYGPASGR